MSFISTSLLLLMSGSLAVEAASIPGGREAWQKLLKMPTLHAEIEGGWSQFDGISLSNDKPNPTVEIPKLRAQLRGTPGDAALYWEMSRIYSRLDDHNNESNALTRAVALFRKQVEAQPENIDVLTRFGIALEADDKSEEAGAVLRHALKNGPEDWRAWSALGHWHNCETWRSINGILPSNAQNATVLLLDKAAKREIPARQLETARKSAEEAARCADRAVALAPNESRAWVDRALVRSGGSTLNHLSAVSRGADPNPKKFQLSLFPTNALADLLRASELSPADLHPLDMAAIGHFMVAMASLSDAALEGMGEGGLLRLLPEVEKQICISVLARLEEIGQNRLSTSAV